MKEITNSKERCHMLGAHGCNALRKTFCNAEDFEKCNYYKPHDCQDQIRVEKGDRVFLYKPEEKGFIRCKNCKHSRLDEKNFDHFLCAKYKDRTMKTWGFCSQGDAIR